MEALILFNGAIIGLAMYFFAASRSKSFWIKRLETELEAMRKEMREWQNKALLKHGTSPLDKPSQPTSKVRQQEITPKVVTRQQLEYRETEPMQTPITIHANDISYQRVARHADVVEKAAEVIAAHK